MAAYSSARPRWHPRGAQDRRAGAARFPARRHAGRAPDRPRRGAARRRLFRVSRHLRQARRARVGRPRQAAGAPRGREFAAPLWPAARLGPAYYRLAFDRREAKKGRQYKVLLRHRRRQRRAPAMTGSARRTARRRAVAPRKCPPISARISPYRPANQWLERRSRGPTQLQWPSGRWSARGASAAAERPGPAYRPPLRRLQIARRLQRHTAVAARRQRGAHAVPRSPNSDVSFGAAAISTRLAPFPSSGAATSADRQ